MLTKWAHQTQNLIEHTGLTNGPDTLANTQTITTIAPLRWLTWNMVYHSAHHTFPGVPFHALPVLHRAIVDKIGHEPPSLGYLAFNRQMIRALAAGVASLVNVLDPEAVVIGGGISKAGDALFHPLAAELAKCEWRPFGQAVPLVPAELGTWAGACGAAFNVMSRA